MVYDEHFGADALPVTFFNGVRTIEVKDDKHDAKPVRISGVILKPRARAHERRRMEDLPSLLSSSGAGKANA